MLLDSPPVSRVSIEEGEIFSLLRISGFAPGLAHAFVVRGRARRRLFRPEPVPRDPICRAAGLPGAVLHLARQVHGSTVVEVPGEGDGRPGVPPPEADALVTRRSGHAVGVATADCLPILLAADRRACAAVHAGWRGLLAGVIGGAVGRLRERTAASTAVRVHAVIGPSIGPCCFEVGGEVAERFQARFPDSDGFLRPSTAGGKSTVDLPRAAVFALEEAGVAPENVSIAGLCTRCGDERLESYRRDHERAGRMIALVGLSGPGGSPQEP